MLCDAPISGAPVPLPPPGPDHVHWVQLRLEVGCTACSQKSPLDRLDMEGRFYCVPCGRMSLFDPALWRETVLPFAAALGDCFWARFGQFPPWPAVAPDAGYFEGAGKPWSEHAAALPKSLREIFPALGVERPRMQIVQTGMIIGPTGMRSRTLAVLIAPGHPLCEKCRAPLALEGAGRGRTTARCNACGTTDTYRAPDAALEASAELCAVLAPDHAEGRLEARVEAQKGTAAVAITCPTCGSALPITSGERFATCRHCGAQALVPTGVLAQAFGAAPAAAARPWWVAIRSPSSLRTLLLGAGRPAYAPWGS
jgi:hypothetical protein